MVLEKRKKCRFIMLAGIQVAEAVSFIWVHLKKEGHQVLNSPFIMKLEIPKEHHLTF
jgi:hypothetical protein